MFIFKFHTYILMVQARYLGHTPQLLGCLSRTRVASIVYVFERGGDEGEEGVMGERRQGEGIGCSGFTRTHLVGTHQSINQ